MKKIKVKFLMYGPLDHTDVGTYANFIFKILKKRFIVEITDSPDYLFYHESDTRHIYYDCVKIFYTGENVSPNFNFCDYAISFDWLTFEDRHFRLPLYLVTTYYLKAELEQSKNISFNKKLNLTKEDIQHKTDFCSFVYSNYRGEAERKIFFDLLSNYKKVNAGGAFLNNIGGKVDNKLAFETKHKFSIAFENSSRSGYTTEKIVNALMAQTIPIYWGDPMIGKQFNTERFINSHDYKNFEEVVARVKEIDMNDELYLEIINKPVMNETYDLEMIMSSFESFLFQIFQQPLHMAKKATINPQRLAGYLEREKAANLYTNSKQGLQRFLATCYRPFKKSRLLEKFKHKIFSS